VCDGIGTDIVAVSRIEALIRASGSRFLERWFTPVEIEYCSAKAVPSRHFAARFAAKEAVVKALPLAWEGPLPWRSVEIENEAGGRPVVRLSGDLLEAAREAGVDAVRISMSHCDEYATAIATVKLVSVRGSARVAEPSRREGAGGEGWGSE
jgi:holo-[acyl-carrier protein] synthase